MSQPEAGTGATCGDLWQQQSAHCNQAAPQGFTEQPQPQALEGHGRHCHRLCGWPGSGFPEGCALECLLAASDQALLIRVHLQDCLPTTMGVSGAFLVGLVAAHESTDISIIVCDPKTLQSVRCRPLRS